MEADALQRAGRAVHGDYKQEEPRRAEPEPERRRSHSARTRRHHRQHASWHDDSYEDEEEDDGAIGALFVQLVLSPWTLPYSILSAQQPDGYRMPSYPYSDHLGYAVPATEAQRTALLRLRMGATARSPYLVSGTLGVQLDFAGAPITLRGDYRMLTEAESGERSFAGLGNAEVLYRFAESPAVRFYSGLGYVQWADAAGFGHGLGLIYGFDSYPVRPISFGSRISAGPLGRSYGLQWRTHLGVLISRFEIQLAYDHLDVGGAQLGGLQLSLETHL